MDKLYSTLFKEGKDSGFTGLKSLEKYVHQKGLAVRNLCSKKMTRLRPHNCLDKMTLSDLQTSWPRLHSKCFCIFGCKESKYTDFRMLALHYLEHNWYDLKCFGIHPNVLHQAVVDKIVPVQKPKRKRAKPDCSEPVVQQNEISYEVTNNDLTCKDTSNYASTQKKKSGESVPLQ